MRILDRLKTAIYGSSSGSREEEQITDQSESFIRNNGNGSNTNNQNGTTAIPDNAAPQQQSAPAASRVASTVNVNAIQRHDDPNVGHLVDSSEQALMNSVNARDEPDW